MDFLNKIKTKNLVKLSILFAICIIAEIPETIARPKLTYKKAIINLIP